MELFSHEIKDTNELKEILKNNKEIPEDYNVAVIAYVFDKENNLIMQRRGPKCRDERFKLEGIGGGVKETDKDFRSALNREILEEVGKEAVIKIEKFITAIGESALDLRDNKEKYWILLLYKGVLEEGKLQIMEPEKNLGFEKYRIGELDENELSSAAKKLYSILKERI